MRSFSQADTCGAAVDNALSWVPPGIETNETGWCSAQRSLNSLSVRAGTTVVSAVPCTSRIGAELRNRPGLFSMATERAGSVRRGSALNIWSRGMPANATAASLRQPVSSTPAFERCSGVT